MARELLRHLALKSSSFSSSSSYSVFFFATPHAGTGLMQKFARGSSDRLGYRNFSVSRNSSQEGANLGSDFGRMGLQGKMSCVVEDHPSAGIVAPIGLRPGREKERIVFSPDRECRRAMGAKVILEFRVKLDVAFVVADQIELNLGTLRAIQQGLVQDDGFRRHALLRIGHSTVVLPAGGFQGRRLRKTSRFSWVGFSQ